MKLDSNSRIGVIGYGSWATALVGQITGGGHPVYWHIRNREVLDGVVNDGYNPKYISDLELDMSLITASGNIDEVVSNSDIVVLAAPSAYLKTFLEPLTVPLEDKFVISAIKGIIPDEYQTVTEYINSRYGVCRKYLGIVSGPSHAEEVSRGKLSYLTVACVDEEDARVFGSMIAGKSLVINYSQDVYGVEYAGVLKNIYALAAGLAAGLGYGDNFLSVLIAACSDEMKRFLDESYPFERNTSSSAYLGDLLVTCYSTYSRNRRLGQLIGHGCTVKSALNEMTMIAEGYFAADCLRHVARRGDISLPIADMVYDVLYRKVRPRKAMEALTAKL